MFSTRYENKAGKEMRDMRWEVTYENDIGREDFHPKEQRYSRMLHPKKTFYLPPTSVSVW